jgi:hypothetical protein
MSIWGSLRFGSRRVVAASSVIGLVVATTAIGVMSSAAPASAGLDVAFRSVFGAGDQIRVVLPAPDGSVYIGGQFTVGGVNDLVKLNRDGSVDQVFKAAELTGPNGTVRTLAFDPSGSILVGGDFTLYGNTTVGHLVELDTNGGVISTFGSGANDGVYKIISLGYHSFLAAGAFTQFGATLHGGVVELDSYVFASNFNATFNGAVNDVVRQPDGRFVAVGFFSQVNGDAHQHIARITGTGATDATLNATIVGLPLTIARLSTGRLAVGGSFTTVDAATRNNFALLNANGTLAAVSFPVANPSSFITQMITLPGDVLLVVGAFTSWIAPGDRSTQGVMKVLANGAPGDPLDVGRGLVGGNYPGLAAARMPDGRLVLAGTFTEIGNELVNSIAVITDVPGPPKSLVVQPGNASALVSWSATLVDGGRPIVEFQVGFINATGTSGGDCVVTSAILLKFTARCTGMKNGVKYTVSVSASNVVGSGPSVVAAVTPRTVPTAPRSPKVTFPVAGKARVAWTVPASNGGAGIQRYDVCRASCAVRSSWKSTGSTAGTPNRFYTFAVKKGTKVTMKIRAVNAAGASPLATLVFTQAK